VNLQIDKSKPSVSITHHLKHLFDKHPAEDKCHFCQCDSEMLTSVLWKNAPQILILRTNSRHYIPQNMMKTSIKTPHGKGVKNEEVFYSLNAVIDYKKISKEAATATATDPTPLPEPSNGDNIPPKGSDMSGNTDGPSGSSAGSHSSAGSGSGSPVGSTRGRRSPAGSSEEEAFERGGKRSRLSSSEDCQDHFEQKKRKLLEPDGARDCSLTDFDKSKDREGHNSSTSSDDSSGSSCSTPTDSSDPDYFYHGWTWVKVAEDRWRCYDDEHVDDDIIGDDVYLEPCSIGALLFYRKHSH